MGGRGLNTGFMDGDEPQLRSRSPFWTPPGSPRPVLSAPEHLLVNGRHQESLPREFFCPITHDVMTEPVVAMDGHTYERAAIERWFLEGKSTSPKTGEQMLGTTLTPNHAMRAQIMTESERRAPKAGQVRMLAEGCWGAPVLALRRSLVALQMSWLNSKTDRFEP